ncbi:MAG: hypothetical protein U9O78_00120 [Patescibacteria group bacterium]|nr:hypothetical protein [Patescibacteria group bacterium]
MKKKLRQMITIGTGMAIVLIISFQLTKAVFTDEELSANTISLGTLNLQVGDEDPVNLPIDLSDMSGQETRIYEVALKNTGTVEGNFWVDAEVLNSLEGENPEAETNTEGEGEADDCIQLLMSVTDPAHDEEILVNSALSALTEQYDHDAQTLVDEMVNGGDATLKLRFYSGNCSSCAMGDTVDLNLMFHLQQEYI